jgi:hypothetical protein
MFMEPRPRILRIFQRPERFLQSLGEGQFVSLSDAQRTVNGHAPERVIGIVRNPHGQPNSISGNVVRKDRVKDGDFWHHTIYVK